MSDQHFVQNSMLQLESYSRGFIENPQRTARRSINDLSSSSVGKIGCVLVFLLILVVTTLPNGNPSIGTNFGTNSLTFSSNCIDNALQKSFVSIIVFTYHNPDALSNQITSISLQFTYFDFELLVVDTGCSPRVASIIEQSAVPITHIQLCHNPGKGVANNVGIDLISASSEFVLFLNDDLILEQGFLSNMARLTKDKDVGAVGCKIIESNGKLKEAGGIVWKRGSEAYGRGKDPEAPQYNFVRSVDYVSGDCLMVQTDIAKDYGFQTEIFDTYFEDIDMCMHIQHKLKLKILYQPLAVAQHSGDSKNEYTIKDADKMKTESIFRQRWATELQNHTEYTAIHRNSLLLRARDTRQDAPHILIVDDGLPRQGFGSGYARSFENACIMMSLGYKLTVIPLGGNEAKIYDPTVPDSGWKPDISTWRILQQAGVEIIRPTPGVPIMLDEWETFINARMGVYDVIIVSRPDTFNLCCRERSFCPVGECTLIFDSEAMVSNRIDRHHTAWDAGEVEFDPNLFPPADNYRKMEYSMLSGSDAFLVASDDDQNYIRRTFTGSFNVWTMGHTMQTDLIPSQSTFDQRQSMILFTGNFYGGLIYNGDAIYRFMKKILPLIISEYRLQRFMGGEGEEETNIKLVVAGKFVTKLPAPPADVAEYVQYIESPHSFDPLFDQAKVFVAPHLYAAGTQWKLSEVMAAGIPCVVSHIAAKGLNGLIPGEIHAAMDDEEFASQVLELLTDKEAWQKMRNNALSYIKRTHSRKALARKWVHIVEGEEKEQSLRDHFFHENQMCELCFNYTVPPQAHIPFPEDQLLNFFPSTVMG